MDSLYTFKATYDDGTFLVGTDDTPYESIDRARLRTFDLIRKDNHDDIKLRVHIAPGQRLVFRRRSRMSFSEKETHIYIVGKQETIDGRNVQRIAVLYNDTGAVELLDKYMETEPFSEPVPIPCEQ